MTRTRLEATDRAVSPVVGVALLIAIAVILAAVIGAVVLGLGTGGADTPQAQLQAQFTELEDDTEEHDVLIIQHNGGEPIAADEVVFVGDDEDLTAYTTFDETGAFADDDEFEDELTAGNSLYIDLEGELDQSVSVIWQDPNSDSEHVLESWEN